MLPLAGPLMAPPPAANPACTHVQGAVAKGGGEGSCSTRAPPWHWWCAAVLGCAVRLAHACLHYVLACIACPMAGPSSLPCLHVHVRPRRMALRDATQECQELVKSTFGAAAKGS